jgi:hypothetical protein
MSPLMPDRKKQARINVRIVWGIRFDALQIKGVPGQRDLVSIPNACSIKAYHTGPRKIFLESVGFLDTPTYVTNSALHHC